MWTKEVVFGLIVLSVVCLTVLSLFVFFFVFLLFHEFYVFVTWGIVMMVWWVLYAIGMFAVEIWKVNVYTLSYIAFVCIAELALSIALFCDPKFFINNQLF